MGENLINMDSRPGWFMSISVLWPCLDASSYDDVKNSSSNHLVPQTISTISGAYKQQQQQLASSAATAAGNGHAGVNGVPPSGAQQPTSFGQGLTPTYWSASQLLKGKVIRWEYFFSMWLKHFLSINTFWVFSLSFEVFLLVCQKQEIRPRESST